MTWLAMQLDGWLLDDWMVGWLDASLFDDLVDKRLVGVVARRLNV